MWKSRFSAEQIIAILNAAEARQKVADLCRSTRSASTRFTTGERSTAGWRSATRVSCGWFATRTRRADPIKPTGQQQECVHACRRIIGSRWASRAECGSAVVRYRGLAKNLTRACATLACSRTTSFSRRSRRCSAERTVLRLRRELRGRARLKPQSLTKPLRDLRTSPCERRSTRSARASGKPGSTRTGCTHHRGRCLRALRDHVSPASLSSPRSRQEAVASSRGISRSLSSPEHRSVSIQSPCPCLPVPPPG